MIEVHFGFEVYNLNFGRIQKGVAATQTAALILKDQARKELLNLISGSDFIAVEAVSPAGANTDRLEVQVTVRPEAPPGRLNETITASLADNSQPASRLSVRGTVVGNVEATPELVRLAADTSRAAADQDEQSIRILSTRSDVRFDVLGIEDLHDYLVLNVDTVVPGEQYTIGARPNERALEAGRTLSGEVRVLISNAEQPEVTFRYNIMFPRQ